MRFSRGARLSTALLACALLPRASEAGRPGSDTGASPRGAVSRTPNYGNDVRPLLERKCLECHGLKSRKADLDLSNPAAILKGGESGPAIVAGKPEESLLFEKIHDGEMPPVKKNRLSSTEVETIRRWILDGARAEGSATAPSETRHDYGPILLRRCAPCHGFGRAEGGLSLLSRSLILRGGKSGPAIVPGKPEQSLLLARIGSGEMPPKTRLIEASVKPIEPLEIEALHTWIAAGAPEANLRPDDVATDHDATVSEKDREFWAFRPPARPSIPHVRDASRVRNPIDAFLLEKLERLGLSLSPEADAASLIRRVAIDLTGLPPHSEEVAAFLKDRSPGAYERMVDRYLASPRYGERWARRWLDLAGYMDSEGKREQDLPRPHAWRYRDYVIRAYSDDKPYDRFLLEQIAGDELADYEHAPEISQEIYDNLTATGFLRMAPDASWANITGYLADRIEVIADEIDILGSGVMGLTIKCARCHSHKFDPIPQRDYYRIAAVLKGAYDEYDWLRPDVRPGLGPLSEDPRPGRHLPYVTTVERKAWEKRDAEIRLDIDRIKASIDRKAADLAAKHLEKESAALPEAIRADVRKSLTTSPERRDPVQKYLAEKFEKILNPDRGALRAKYPEFQKVCEEADSEIASLETKRPPEPRIQALWDRGEPTPTYVYRRGDPMNLGPVVEPGEPAVLAADKARFEATPPWPGAKTTGRRLAFARRLVRPNHPLTARVAINRIWKYHFGVGIVATLGNFGKVGAPPTNPELLDWLATEFVARGWSVKAMHRLMLTSATYRQSSRVSPEAERLDPDNVRLSRMPMSRLDAEALYDSQLFVAGDLDDRRFGPADPVATRPDGLTTPERSPRGRRRMIYVKLTRKLVPTHLETFDFPQMNPNCIERRDSTVPTQALHLMNNGLIDELADRLAANVAREAGESLEARIERVFLRALSRPPDDRERAAGAAALARLTEAWAADLARVGPPDFDKSGRKALGTYCHAILNSADFLHVD